MMGRYLQLQAETFKDKEEYLQEMGAIPLSFVPRWEELRNGETFLVLGERGYFHYVAWVYDREEYVEFSSPSHVEVQKWFLIEAVVIETFVVEQEKAGRDSIAATPPQRPNEHAQATPESLGTPYPLLAFRRPHRS